MNDQPPATPAAALTPGLRRFLYLASAICGAAVLIVEILGAKMLAPYFGTSHFVWTAQIAVTLISLSAGYYAGGWFVDRTCDLGRLFSCIFGAAIYLCLTVPLCRPVAEACLDLKLAVGSLLASSFLFFVPLGLLAMTSPFLVRVMTASLSGVGKQAGRLSAISTFGSVLGTVMIGYFLIPFFPNSVTMLCTSGVLAVLAVVYAIVWGRGNRVRSALGMVLLAGGAAAYLVLLPEDRTMPGYSEIERANSNFGMLQVVKQDDQPYYFLLNDLLRQNGYDSEHHQSVHSFTYLLNLLSHAYTPKISNALFIGMGVGIVPMQFAREGIITDVVEINPAMVPMAERYFDFDRKKVNLTIDDGRHFLNRAPRQYDTIILDAFVGDSSPSHLMTREAFAAMHSALRPNGTLVINSFGDLRADNDYYTASLYKTLSAVFKSVKIHAARDDGNIFFVASDQPQLVTLHQPDLTTVHPELVETVTRAIQRTVETDPRHGRVLTDDFNPVEFYDAQNRERLRRELVASTIH